MRLGVKQPKLPESARLPRVAAGIQAHWLAGTSHFVWRTTPSRIDLGVRSPVNELQERRRPGQNLSACHRGWSKSALEEFETASASAKSFHAGRHLNEQLYFSPCSTTAQKYCRAMPSGDEEQIKTVKCFGMALGRAVIEREKAEKGRKGPPEQRAKRAKGGKGAGRSANCAQGCCLKVQRSRTSKRESTVTFEFHRKEADYPRTLAHISYSGVASAIVVARCSKTSCVGTPNLFRNLRARAVFFRRHGADRGRPRQIPWTTNWSQPSLPMWVFMSK